MNNMDEDEDFYNYYTVNPKTGALTFDKSHYTYVTLRDAFAMAGVDINTLTTEEALIETEIALAETVAKYVQVRLMNRDPSKSLETALLQARLRSDDDLANHIREKLKRRRDLDLQLHPGKN
jgi:hypothetical protein